jgi:hypothetical protein
VTERGEGLQRVPRAERPITLGERGQLFRRSRYAIHEMPGLSVEQRQLVLGTLGDAGRDSKKLPALATLLQELGVPEKLPRNAASPARLRPRRS